MKISLPYGNGSVEANLAHGRVVGTLDIAEAPALRNIEASAREALENPIGAVAPLRAQLQPGQTATIIVSDSFRTTGIDQCLPALLEVLAARGIPDENITFLYATGTHRGPTPAEAEKILGEAVFARFGTRAVAHDPFNANGLVDLGPTSRGTPVHLNRHVVACDHLIVTGTVVLHYFGGFGGGRKSLLPGVAGEASISRNHAMNLHPSEDRLDPSVRIGVLAGNPVAEDMLEGALKVRTSYLLNTVLNRHGQIAGIFGGELVAAHEAACAFAARLYCVPIEAQADVVIASAGGAKNYLQSHKALFNAYQALKPGGRILFLAAAPEGLGGNKLAEWLALASPEAVMRALRERAEINGQTALSTLEKSRHTTFITEMTDDMVAVLGGRKAASLQAAIDDLCTHAYSVCLMPSASYTVPMLG